MKHFLLIFLIIFTLPSNSKIEAFNEFVSKFQSVAEMPFSLAEEEVISFDARAYLHGGN